MKIILNGEEKNPNEIRKILAAISNKKILKEKGGYVTKTSILDNHFFIGIIPAFIEGRKKYHYDIKLEYENQFTLIGSINADETMTIVFKLDKETYLRGLSEKEKAKMRNNYIKFARVFTDNGFPEDFKLDSSTIMLLERSRLFEKTPKILEEISKVEVLEDL